ncbi:Isochorismatase-like protein [Geopyxis carbonaria]|nr:Isochorismatase-like protein [Geopyxis carbonaria]
MQFSHLTTLLLTATATVVSASSDYVYSRLNASTALVLVVDIQVGLYHQVRDQTPSEYRNNILAHSALGKLFDMPVILTTSAETGPNGPLPKEIAGMYPNAPVIRRQGEVNAWDNAEFRAAVTKTGRKQIILAGITTDVCTTFLALALRAAGYEVWANTDASGTFDRRIADESNVRMRNAGVTTIGTFSIVCDLMKDWRNTPGSAEVLPWLDTYLPSYGYLARAHGAAVTKGKLNPGEQGLLG